MATLIVGPLPASYKMRFLLTAICRTTRFFHCMPLPEASASAAGTAFLQGWLSFFGMPSVVSCDAGGSFTASLWREMMRNLNIVKYSALYRPQSVGMLERQHRSLKDSLKAAIEDMAEKHQDKWMDHTPFVLLGKRGPSNQISAPVLQSSPSGRTSGFQVNTSMTLVPLQLSLSSSGSYTRQHKAQGLQVPYEGPFPIVERPSWSTVKIDVGAFKSGERRYEIQHRNDIKVAHPKSLAAPAQRPTLGRPPQVQTSAQSDPSTSTDAQAETSLPFQKPSNQFLEPPLHQQAPGSKQTTAKSDGKSRHVNHATSTRQNRLSSPDPPGIPPFITTRPVRSTRNPDPIYVDGIQWSSLRPWSASKTEISALNSLINKSN